MTHDPTIRINVDPTNPGQFFACCGLFELASRLWSDSTGHFATNGRTFIVGGPRIDTANSLMEAIRGCSIKSSLGESQIARLKSLRAVAKDKRSPDDIADLSKLSSSLDQERMVLGEPFDMAIDWWQDNYSGGQLFKTWAGLQLASELVDGLWRGIKESAFSDQSAEDWLSVVSQFDSLPLYYDSDIGAQSSSLDVGFSLDKLKMSASTRPMLEFAAFVGLQRFRPTFRDSERRMTYSLWHSPLSPLLAASVANGATNLGAVSKLEYQLLYRTKYLKSFLPGRRKDHAHESTEVVRCLSGR